ncbi:MAG: DUF3857 domain-containing protein [Lutibacter sp.]|uniref:DUF3857 domain-containing protein n=1 Tax=Lutibacter sp. TaxID=1925666 RepID=UPI0019DEFF30|nr:DUF3857 domain-containing protein [Lutibacter sp.]NOR28416.1 DUF3857 domain-containing protein [Lutibacter sp.]
MKKIAILITFLLSINTNSQEQINYTFGEPTIDELNLKTYKLDSTANAVILYESGTTEFKYKYKKVIISTTYYKKVKFFNKEGFDQATFEINLYNDDTSKDNIINIKGITHNNSSKTNLSKTQIFEKKITKNLRTVSFAMPNLKEGSIIEVEYTVETPRLEYNLKSWKFQSTIPTIYSQYKAYIPLNFVYNRMLNGFQKLSVNTTTIEKICLVVPGYSNPASCEVVTYAMENIPAFVEEEYMTDKDNFISMVEFQLSKLKRFDGFVRNYTTTWKDVDHRFKKDKDIGKQLKKMAFFENKLPSQLKLLNSDLEKAKLIYSFIQNHYTWNERNGMFNYVDIRKAYKNKIGDVREINISLINALKAAGLNAELMLISTRDNGTPTKVYPIISEFNYVIAKVNIGATSYLLDATSKLTPFGILPFKCLNSYGRVMDFENESYWFNIVPIKNSKTQFYASLKLNKNGIINGKLRKVSLGYNALLRREEIVGKSKEDIANEFESSFNNLEVIDYTIENKTDIYKPVIETFEVEIEDINNFDKLYLSPFFTTQHKENPFKQENRLYPVNFGFPFKNAINFSLELPENYKIETYPESKAFVLIQNGGTFNIITKNHENSRFTLNSTVEINKPIYSNLEYHSLKNLFKHIIKSQKTPIAIQKK